jgi:hypothetical protein
MIDSFFMASVITPSPPDTQGQNGKCIKLSQTSWLYGSDFSLSKNQRHQSSFSSVQRRPMIAATSVGSACWILAGGLFAFFAIDGGGALGIVAIGDDE